MTVNVKIKQMRDGRHPLPSYATKGDAGADFYAYLEEPVRLFQGDRALIPLGVAMEIPAGYELQLRARSGLALKKGIALVNGIGTIDETYRGELGAIIVNLGNDMVVVNSGDKICQGVLNKYEQINFEESAELGTTERGEGGFGHSGV